MKKIIFTLMALIVGFTFTSCSDDDWSTDSSLDHEYFYGFNDWGKFKNDVVFQIANGETATIATHFWSERPQKGINAEVAYYTVSDDLTLGVDFQVVDDDGNALTPDSDGGYKVVWENCTKGDKNINIKALSSKKGNVIVTTWNPRRTGDDAISFANTYIVKTDKYSVRAFTENYKVTVKMNH